MKNVLITGGAGFIGSNLTRHILGQYPEAQVRIIDIFLPGEIAHINTNFICKEFPGRCSVTKTDIRDKKIVEQEFKKYLFDTVFHLAGISSNPLAYLNPDLTSKINKEGTKIIFDAAKNHGVDIFYHQSTCEIYGNRHTLNPHNVDSTYGAHSPYNQSKAHADKFVSVEMTNSQNMKIILGRPSNVYGPWQHIGPVISNFIRRIIDHQPITITGNGKQIREWLHVDDLCKAILCLAENKKTGVYNIGSGEEFCINDVAKLIFGILGITAINFSETRAHEDPNGYLLDSSKIGELGWKPDMKFYERLCQTINWYQEFYPTHKHLWDESRLSPEWNSLIVEFEQSKRNKETF